jgi:hypothetical protein
MNFLFFISPLQVNFAYEEHGERKNALVKLRLCPPCSEKLNHHSVKRRAKQTRKKVKKEEQEAGSGFLKMFEKKSWKIHCENGFRRRNGGRRFWRRPKKTPPPWKWRRRREEKAAAEG